MARQLTIGLHGGSIAMRADGPEEAVAIYGLGRLLRLNVNESEGSFADAEIVPPDRMPEGRHTLRSTLLTETAYAPDWSRVLICGWKKPPKRPFFLPAPCMADSSDLHGDERHSARRKRCSDALRRAGN